MAQLPVIFGCEGATLSAAERAFFREVDPFGFILFARNILDPDQVRALTAALRETVGWQAPILIDQEGGRVQRMRAPHWREYLPALDQMGRARDPLRAQWLRNRLIAQELLALGIDVNCAPLADLVEADTHPILRNRLYGSSPALVAQAARAAAEGLIAGGVLPVVKHLPGYGRATVDSHLALPRVAAPLADLRTRDFAPFRALRDLPMGMTAHIVIEAIDPDQPATTSAPVMAEIRQGIGFGGLIMTDDLNMQALSGTLTERAARSLAAGCDIVLQCNGKRADMEAVVAGLSEMTEAARARASAALAWRRPPEGADVPALLAEFAAIVPA